jgi:dynactin complex subunit
MAIRSAADQERIDRERAAVQITTVKSEEPSKEETVEAKTEEQETKEVVEEKTTDEAATEEATEENVDETKEEVTEEVTEAKDAIEENNEEKKDLQQQKKEAKTPEEKDRIQRRIDRLTAKNDRLTRELEAANAKLAELAKGDDGTVKLTEADIEARAEQKATQKDLERQFVHAVNSTHDAAMAVNKDFKGKIDEVISELGPVPGQLILALQDLPNKGEVLYHIANDIDVAEKFYEIVQNPIKLGREIEKLSSELSKPKPKPVSKTPKPPAPVGTRQAPNATTNLHNTKNTEEWIKQRQAEVEKKYREKYIMPTR